MERNRQLTGAGMYGQFAGQVPQLSYQDAAARAGVGAQLEGKTQQNLGLRYQDYLDQFYFPQEQQNWFLSQIGGAPYTTVQESAYPGPQGPNTFAQNLGAFGMAAGGLGSFFRR